MYPKEIVFAVAAQNMNAVVPALDTIQIFCSYSRKDEALYEELEKHLTILQSVGVISSWRDRAIPTGKDWQGQIDEHLNSAHIILLLISPDFLASKYIREVEVKRALERHNAGDAVVISVILRDVDWQGSPLSKLQALPRDALPVTSWPNRDQAFKDIAVGIRRVAERLRSSNAATGRTQSFERTTNASNSPRMFNRAVLYAIGSLVVVGFLAGLPYFVVRRVEQKRQAQLDSIKAVKEWATINIDAHLLSDCMAVPPCVARREQADRLRAVADWQHISFDFALLSDCMAFPQCLTRREQADRLRAVADWQHISFNFPLLSDCMAFPPCVARREQADKLRTADWQHIQFGSPLLADCMDVSECSKRREEVDKRNQKRNDDSKTLTRPLKRFCR